MKKFVIFGLGRSGSHLLANLLDNLPRVRCDDEILNPDVLSGINRRLMPLIHRHPMQFISFRRYVAMSRQPGSSYGFMLKGTQLNRIAWPSDLLPRLYRSDWGIIHLQRQSLFSLSVSEIVARRSGRWNSRTEEQDVDMDRILVEPSYFLDIYYKKKHLIRQCHARVANLPHLSLTYENDLQSPEQWQGTVCRVCDYLGIKVPSSPVRSSVRKTWRKPYNELIENHDELLELAREHGEPL